MYICIYVDIYAYIFIYKYKSYSTCLESAAALGQECNFRGNWLPSHITLAPLRWPSPSSLPPLGVLMLNTQHPYINAFVSHSQGHKWIRLYWSKDLGGKQDLLTLTDNIWEQYEANVFPSIQYREIFRQRNIGDGRTSELSRSEVLLGWGQSAALYSLG